MTNFSFIPSSFGSLSATLLKAEQHVHHDAPYAAFLCRKALEEWVRWIYEHDGDPKKAFKGEYITKAGNPFHWKLSERKVFINQFCILEE